jgi:hypothetical protein
MRSETKREREITKASQIIQTNWRRGVGPPVIVINTFVNGSKWYQLVSIGIIGELW